MELSDEDAKLERATDDVISPVLLSTKCAQILFARTFDIEFPRNQCLCSYISN